MRVYELARDLDVTSEALLHLLREMGISVGSHMASISDKDIARVLARFERERRTKRKSAAEAIEAAIEDAQSSTRRRRRRRVEAPSPASAVEEAHEAHEEVSPPAVSRAEEGAPAAVEKLAAIGERPEKRRARAAPLRLLEEAAPGVPAPEAEAARIEAGREAPVAETAAAPVVEASARPVPEPMEGRMAPPALEEKMREAKATPVVARAPVRPAGVPRPVRPVRPVRVPTPAASAGPGGQVRIKTEGFTTDGRFRSKRERKKKKRQRVDQGAVQENLQRIMAELKGGVRKRRRVARAEGPSEEELEAEEARQQEEARTVRVNEFLTVAELAELVQVPATEIIGSAFKNLGLMITINQRLDFDQIELILEEFGYRAERVAEYGAIEEEMAEEERPEERMLRPPVVTVMGHVDHGKTRLLDFIRKTNVVAGEAGGITQHIGAYHVKLDGGRSITFLDTPGHAAFTAMRARGAEVTDLVILVVAADDSVMPQTVEAISHAKNAGVPIVVAVNKVDLPQANPLRVKQELLGHAVTVEDFGGDVLCAEVSAKTGEGVDDLLEKVLLQAEVLELKANVGHHARGAVIEAELDVGKGPVATILVQDGTLRVGDSFVCGLRDGRVRAMLDERGRPVQEAGPGIPVQVLGFAGMPQAGDGFQVMSTERATEIAQRRQRLDREKQLRIKGRGVRLDVLSQMLAEGRTTRLGLVIKADVDGSVQALSDALEQLGTPEVRVEIIHRGVGAINESDVLLAAASGAIIIGFRVRPDTNARLLGEREGVEIRLYEIIYEAVDDVKAAMEGMLEPERREKVLGSAEARQLFRIAKVGTVAGCYVTAGAVRRGRARVVRDGVSVYDGEIASLKRFKDDVREVREGFECGIGIANFNDLKVGDVIECYVVEEFARTLASAGEAKA
ncbi:MAG: translation initiation factor IF-2 [Gemmatimonadetes bacterium]|nr:translation initiation factor IF-2 [Gemmatimonadota bacterium]